MHVRNKPPPKTTILVQHVHECAPTTRKSTQQVEQRKKKESHKKQCFVTITRVPRVLYMVTSSPMIHLLSLTRKNKKKKCLNTGLHHRRAV